MQAIKTGAEIPMAPDPEIPKSARARLPSAVGQFTRSCQSGPLLHHWRVSSPRSVQLTWVRRGAPQSSASNFSGSGSACAVRWVEVYAHAPFLGMYSS